MPAAPRPDRTDLDGWLSDAAYFVRTTAANLRAAAVAADAIDAALATEIRTALTALEASLAPTVKAQRSNQTAIRTDQSHCIVI